MNPLMTARTAVYSLTANKLRSALTVLGVVIGVGAVIALMSIGKGSQAAITERIQGLGSNLVFVRPGAPNQEGVRGAQGSAATLTLADAEALADPVGAPDVAFVAPETNTFARVVAGATNVQTRILGTTPEYQVVRSFNLADGRFITEQDVQASSVVAVLGSNVSQSLFGALSPVGQIIRINNRPFTVVGLLASKGGTALGLEDDIIVVPITTARFRLSAQRTAQGVFNVQTVNVQAINDGRIEAAKTQVTTILRERHNIILGSADDFTLTSQEDIIQTANQVTATLTLFLGSVAGISLLVGGIGIMNIMLVSVTERTREVGIRKALGARRGDILRQFLTEAVILSFSGGALGLALGWGMAQAFKGLTLNGQSINTLVTPDIVILAVSVSVAIGLFFGLYPAARAARLNPVEALHYE